MNEMEQGRRRYFWVLKKWSSYSAWKKCADTFDQFVTEYETSVQYWPAGEAPPEYNLKYAYEAQQLYKKGLELLRSGNRIVWREHEEGYLKTAASRASKAMEAITSQSFNETMGGDHGYPKYRKWTEGLERLRQLKIAATPRVTLVAEPVPMKYYGNDKAPARKGIFDAQINAALDVIDPETGLPSYGLVPKECPPTPPPQSLVIESGEVLPCDGIWEPVFPREPAGLTDSLNYLLKGAKAPWALDEHRREMHKQNVLPISWRLVWEDERYRNGSTDDEDYEGPKEILAPLEQKGPTRIEGGLVCPRTGYWYTPAQENSRKFFNARDDMPIIVGSSYGATIWYWDNNQG